MTSTFFQNKQQKIKALKIHYKIWKTHTEKESGTVLTFYQLISNLSGGFLHPMSSLCGSQGCFLCVDQKQSVTQPFGYNQNLPMSLSVVFSRNSLCHGISQESIFPQNLFSHSSLFCLQHACTLPSETAFLSCQSQAFFSPLRQYLQMLPYFAAETS